MRLLGQLATWGVTIVVMRLLHPADYGVMGLAGVFVSFLNMINTWGLCSAIVQRRDIDEKQMNSVFGIVLVVSLLFYLSLWIAAPFIANFYNEEKLISMIRSLAITFLLSSITVIPSSLMWRDLEYGKLAVIDFVSAISGSAVTLFFAYLGMGVWSLVAGYLMIRLATTVGTQYARPFLRLPSFKIKGIEPIIVFSYRVTASQILWYLYSSAAATLIIGRLLGKEKLGIYEVGLYIACLPMEKVSGIINTVAFPAFSTLQTDPHLAGSHFLKAIRILCFVTFPIFCGISSVGNEIVAVFLGAKWMQAVLPIQLISLIVPLRMVRNLMAPATLGLGRSDVALYIEKVAVVVMPLSFLVGAFYGLIGVCLAWVLVFPFIFIENLYRVARVLDIKVVGVLNAMFKPALSSAFMYLCVYLAKITFLATFPVLTKMILLIVCGIAAYGVAVLLFNRKMVGEVRALVKA